MLLKLNKKGAASLPDKKKAIEPGRHPDLHEVLATVQFKVTNIGKLAGATVPQLYVGFPQDTTPDRTPVKMLRGFEKVHIKAGHRQIVKFEITRKDISFKNVVK
ncbi:hypothetical protein BDV27DRAFT_153475 [Aspergillus caelatus]|uniref:beta-glucosidase n=1 Tax=Aspergillus caelatus TaxID=61420 RepID=A0A5N7AGL9_9EURO|nr:uncharacterized protein BDV27DRAFT_153475 [Aspergillus caelatus]KAE8369021.1 hypothetical protein BDV27DRAFT_153475 [Aspergillus caelatus]